MFTCEAVADILALSFARWKHCSVRCCLSAVPGPPEAVSVSDVLSTSCAVTYQPPLSDGGSPVTGYHVERQTPGSRWIRVNKEAVPDLSCPVTDLLEGNEYEFRVAAENKAGLGEYSAATPRITAKNPWDKPGKPGRPVAVEVVGASVKLEWNAPDRYGCSSCCHGYGMTVPVQAPGTAEQARSVSWLNQVLVSFGPV